MANLLSLHSPRAAASVDILRSKRAPAVLQAVAVVGFALLTALAAQFRLYLWEVPFTLQTAVVFGSGLFLGWRNGLLAQLLYLTLGLFLPVFAGDGYGPAYLFGALSAGYLLSYPVAAALVGKLSEHWNSFLGSSLAMAVGACLIFGFGVVWLYHAAGDFTWWEALDKGFVRFIPIDAAKVVGITLLYSGLRRW